MFRSILLSASVAGLLAAIALTLLQLTWITPLILTAETYEEAAAATTTHDDVDHAAHHHDDADDDSHSHEHLNSAHAEHEHASAHEHEHHADAWQPANGFERTFYTFVSNTVMGVAYALMLVGVYTLWEQPRGIAQGLLFGLAGFAIFFAAPGLGLPPELPGTEAADLGQRQLWWVGTAASTAVALTLLCVQKNWWLRALGGVILVIPHLVVGAPHPAVASSAAPAELQHQFQIATVIGNAVFWLLLGAISAIVWRKLADTPKTATR